MAKIDVKAVLSDCAPEKAFWARNGEVYRNLSALTGGLRKMDAHAFAHHATSQKNDFAKWVCDVFGDAVLAKQLVREKQPRAMAKKISVRLKDMRSSLRNQ